MALTPSRFIPHEAKTTLLAVTSYDDQNIRGYLSNPLYGKRLYFNNLTQLLFSMDRMLDELAFPQNEMQRRTFSGRSDSSPELAAPRETPVEPIASFKIKVLFRQNASWQGSIYWTDKESESQFRSVFELITLIDSALNDAQRLPAADAIA